MDDSVIYIRTPFSLNQDLSFGGEFVEDAKTVLSLPVRQVHAIAEALEQHGGFLDVDTIEGVIAPLVQDEDQRQRLARFISFLDKMLAQLKKPSKDFVEIL